MKLAKFNYSSSSKILLIILIRNNNFYSKIMKLSHKYFQQNLIIIIKITKMTKVEIKTFLEAKTIFLISQILNNKIT